MHATLNTVNGVIGLHLCLIDVGHQMESYVAITLYWEYHFLHQITYVVNMHTKKMI